MALNLSRAVGVAAGGAHGTAVTATAAGLAERQVTLAERQGELFAHGVRTILDKIGLTEAKAAMVPGVIEATVLALSAG